MLMECDVSSCPAIDIGTSFSITAQLQGHSARGLEKTFCEMWSHAFGPPGIIAINLDTGLQAGFLRFSEWHGTRLRPIAGQAHWQQGAIERHIEVWNRIVDDHAAAQEDLPLAITAVNNALNTLRKQSGFSPSSLTPA